MSPITGILPNILTYYDFCPEILEYVMPLLRGETCSSFVVQVGEVITVTFKPVQDGNFIDLTHDENWETRIINWSNRLKDKYEYYPVPLREQKTETELECVLLRGSSKDNIPGHLSWQFLDI